MRFLISKAVKYQYGRCLSILTLVFFSQLAAAACPSDAQVKQYLSAFAKRQASQGFGQDIGLEDAQCARQKLGAELPLYLGKRVGYKAVFTAPTAPSSRTSASGAAAVSTFNGRLDWGYVFDRNLVDIIAVLPAQFGARPVYQPSLIIEVSDPRFAEAKTVQDALAYVDSVTPFIELPDLMMEGPLSDNAYLSINLGFKGGVLGQEIKVNENSRRLIGEQLTRMVVVVTENDQEVARTPLGHPMEAALALARALKKEGIQLKRGDFLCLGGFSPPKTPQSGLKLNVRYEGLGNSPSLGIEFN